MIISIDEHPKQFMKYLTRCFRCAETYKCSNKKDRYIDIPLSIDIETTSVNDFAFPYIYMFGINGMAWYTRYKNIFIEVVYDIIDMCEYNDCKILCFIHNLTYELTFFNGYFDEIEVFATDNNKPLYCDIKNMKIIDSYRLVNMSLYKMSKNYNLPHKKLLGDLDYNIFRDCTTPLTYNELHYCENDVLILNDYYRLVYKTFALTKKKIFRVFYTSTSIVRNKIQSHIKNRKDVYNACLQLNQNYNVDVFEMLNTAYSGAFVKANLHLARQKFINVEMYDYTSSYIGVMLEYKYPMYRYSESNDSIKEIINNAENYGYLLRLYIDIEGTTTGFSTLSRNKCLSCENVIMDNGRIKKGKIVIDVGEYDLINILRFYKINEIKILKQFKSKKEYLPLYILDTVKELYAKKQALKYDKNRDETLYLLIKGMLNSIYGCCVEKNHDMRYIYDKATGLYHCEKNTSTKKGFLCLQWGLHITQMARYNILTTIYKIEKYKKDSVIYCDTDSLKINACDEEIRNIIEISNKHYQELINKCCIAKKLNPTDFSGIGLWDYEGKADTFSTAGSKRYVYTKKGKCNITISGINKQKLYEYCTINCINPMDLMTEYTTFHVPTDFTNKLVGKYIALDDFKQYDVNCNATKGYVLLKPVDFTFNMQDDYIDLINLALSDDNIFEIGEI